MLISMVSFIVECMNPRFTLGQNCQNYTNLWNYKPQIQLVVTKFVFLFALVQRVYNKLLWFFLYACMYILHCAI